MKLVASRYEEEYLVYSGSRCPVCKTENIMGCGGIEVDGDTCSQEVMCNECEATWSDVYNLVGIDNLEVPEEA
jgi:hypothetical protein